MILPPQPKQPKKKTKSTMDKKTSQTKKESIKDSTFKMENIEEIINKHFSDISKSEHSDGVFNNLGIVAFIILILCLFFIPSKTNELSSVSNQMIIDEINKMKQQIEKLSKEK